MPEGLLFRVDPVCDSNILLQTPDGELAFIFGQPRGRAGKVGKNEECHGCKGHCDGAFDDLAEQHVSKPSSMENIDPYKEPNHRKVSKAITQ